MTWLWHIHDVIGVNTQCKHTDKCYVISRLPDRKENLKHKLISSPLRPEDVTFNVCMAIVRLTHCARCVSVLLFCYTLETVRLSLGSILVCERSEVQQDIQDNKILNLNTELLVNVTCWQPVNKRFRTVCPLLGTTMVNTSIYQTCLNRGF